MADNIEHQDKVELVANCDRFNSLKHSTVRSYAFTEQGVAMLSTVLRSETAIRVNQIMIDRDLAELYGVETKRLNEAVKRNIELLILE